MLIATVGLTHRRPVIKYFACTPIHALRALDGQVLRGIRGIGVNFTQHACALAQLSALARQNHLSLGPVVIDTNGLCNLGEVTLAIRRNPSLASESVS